MINAVDFFLAQSGVIMLLIMRIMRSFARNGLVGVNLLVVIVFFWTKIELKSTITTYGNT